jgi:transcriptional regulator with XRE-family HTH domain
VRPRPGRARLRLLRGWASGIHQTAVARIESGERKPTLDTIFKLARGLEVPPAELFAGIN